MYLRHTTVRKNGKVHRYWRLVRSVRVGRRVIQQTVAHLGELDERGRLEARALARHLIGAPEHAQLFDDGSEHGAGALGKVRPIWHQREDRVQAHILVCFLAFVLWKSLEMWQQRAGLGNSPRTILEELARIQSHDVVLPTATHGQIRLRCVTQPDSAQAALLDRLGIILPKRMRVAEHELPAFARSA
jgi:hypothetical protein